MENNFIDTLYNLAQLDIDAASAYEQALKNIEDKEIYANIDKFRQDHLQHIDDLSVLIQQYGGTPPERSKDFKGYLIEGFTSLRSITGTKGALSAMQTNELLTNKTYKNALEKHPDLPLDVKVILEKNYGDEKTHLAYIKQALQSLQVT